MNNTELKIRGNSGCSLAIIEENGEMLVKKSCDKSYITRLKKQCQKQSYASDDIPRRFSLFDVPSCKWKDDHMIMPYIHSQSFIEWAERCSIGDIKDLCDELCKFINFEVLNSDSRLVKKDVFLDKINSIRNADTPLLQSIGKEGLYMMCNEAEKAVHDIYVPVGVCHGDLTMSNILFTNHKHYLIDFLDSYIETPLQDIVKIRQDTRYNWTLMMTSQKYNDAHISTVLNYIDNYIVDRYKDLDYYKDNYLIMQFMNFLRILPYAKTNEVYDFVFEVLIELLNGNYEQ